MRRNLASLRAKASSTSSAGPAFLTVISQPGVFALASSSAWSGTTIRAASDGSACRAEISRPAWCAARKSAAPGESISRVVVPSLRRASATASVAAPAGLVRRNVMVREVVIIILSGYLFSNLAHETIEMAGRAVGTAWGARA
ncbi:MAG: hypothetical protein F4085_04785 [Acidimicrobiia bacterium]|nr:hypothetical protein [Acidimicrobiia bacterium]